MEGGRDRGRDELVEHAGQQVEGRRKKEEKEEWEKKGKRMVGLKANAVKALGGRAD